MKAQTRCPTQNLQNKATEIFGALIVLRKKEKAIGARLKVYLSIQKYFDCEKQESVAGISYQENRRLCEEFVKTKSSSMHFII